MESKEPNSKQIDTSILIQCEDCTFSELVEPNSEKMPVDVLIEHGDETGHRVVPKPLEE